MRRGWMLLGLAAGLGAAAGPTLRSRAEGTTNPLLGQQDAIDAGEQIYRGKCVLCHGRSGLRGPNLFATRLTDEQFMETVTNGRKGTQMPAFGLRLSPDEVWQVEAFVRSRDGL